MASQIALSHHERWDGTVYPQGLAGNAIPLPARIAALADVFDALTHARPYKKAWNLRKAIEAIEQESGRHFDPALAPAFLSVLRAQELQRLAAKFDAEIDRGVVQKIWLFDGRALKSPPAGHFRYSAESIAMTPGGDEKVLTL